MIARFTVLSQQECQDLLALTNADDFRHSQTMGGVQVRLSSELRVNPRMHPVLDGRLFKAFERGLDLYVRAYPEIPLHVTRDEGYQILRYESGGYYRVHVDDHPERPRTLSAILYLNDDYEGGETRFPAQDMRIKAKAGMMILFPSCFAYPHESLPVLSGTKYAAVTWFR